MAAAWARQLRGRFKTTGQLAAILVGDNPASVVYLQKKAEMASTLAAKFELYRFSAGASQAVVEKQIAKLNADKRVAGVIVQLPLPSRFDTSKVVNAIAPSKDVDGLTDANIADRRMLPATAAGILKLLDAYRIKLCGQKIALVGFTRLLNIPLSIYFAGLDNSVVVLQKGTRDMAELKSADIVITATGQPRLIAGRQIKSGAVVVDAGASRVGKKLVGDVDFASANRRAKWITPVPGGVGPMTVTALYANLLSAAKLRS